MTLPGSVGHELNNYLLHFDRKLNKTWNNKLNTVRSNQANYLIVRLKVDQRAGQLSLPHLGITKTEKNRTKT